MQGKTTFPIPNESPDSRYLSGFGAGEPFDPHAHTHRMANYPVVSLVPRESVGGEG